MKIAYIKWRDSCYRYGSEYLTRAQNINVVIFESVGFLLYEDSDRITICQDLDNYNQVRCITVIPRENVVEFKVIVGEQE